MNKSICIGWDVGGMHGANNALAAIEVSNSQKSVKVLKGYKKPKTAEDLAEEIAKDILNIAKTSEQTLLAIDAPLCFPKAFVQQMSRLNKIAPLSYGKQINNELAYRKSETYLFNKTLKRPLSSTFDQLTSLTFLVLRVFQIIKDSATPLNQLPFDSFSLRQGINAFECYPGNLKPGKTVRVEQEYFWKNSASLLNETSSEHQKDAMLCALFAVHELCKKNEKRLLVSDDFKDLAKHEGWIYGFYD